jgi:hypothetical protein
MAAAKKEKEKKAIKTGTSSRHITNIEQSIWETFHIYGLPPPTGQSTLPLGDINICLLWQ